MTNHVTVASLVVDFAGAVLLARGVVFQSAEQYVRENPGPLFARSAYPTRDLARARDEAEARVGVGLLLVGVVGQVIGAVHRIDAGTFVWVPYALAGLVIAGGLAAVPLVRRRRERVLFLAQLRVYGDHDAVDSWRTEMKERGREDDLDRWVLDWTRERI